MIMDIKERLNTYSDINKNSKPMTAATVQSNSENG